MAWLRDNNTHVNSGVDMSDLIKTDNSKVIAQLESKIAELEKERECGYIKWQEKFAKIKLERDQFASIVDHHCDLNELGQSERMQKLVSCLAIRDLEQQAKGIKSLIIADAQTIEAASMNFHYAAKAKKLLNQAKALKENNK